MTEKNLIKIYVNATSAKRVDIIIRHESTLSENDWKHRNEIYDRI